MKLPFLCFRISNGIGLQVKVGGKWVPGDEQVANNIAQLLKEAFPRQHKEAL